MDTTKILRFHFNNLWHDPEFRFENSINHINSNYTDKEDFFEANKFTTSLITFIQGQSFFISHFSHPTNLEIKRITTN